MPEVLGYAARRSVHPTVAVIGMAGVKADLCQNGLLDGRR